MWASRDFQTRGTEQFRCIQYNMPCPWEKVPWCKCLSVSGRGCGFTCGEGTGRQGGYPRKDEDHFPKRPDHLRAEPGT